jgi:hypothetical protein
MESALQLLKDGRNKDLWDRCCGFYDLDIEQFMTIQKQLLSEQIELLSKCALGKKLFQGAQPRTIEEFRAMVPLTTYNDYKPFLSEKIEDALPEKPVMWLRTSGRSVENSCKWAPVTKRMYQEIGNMVLGVFIAGSCKNKGEITLSPNDKILYGLAPPPYASGVWMRRLDEEGILKFLPPVSEAENMEFQERIEAGFSLALNEGLDVMGAISSILIAIGEQFGKGGGAKRIGAVLKKPKQLPRLLRAVLRSKLARRPLLPKDIWTLKGLLCSGTDAFIYREKLKYMWGKYPLDVYGATEGCAFVSAQAWNYKDMTFVPYSNFLEFLPMNEYSKWKQDPKCHPHTLLLEEVAPGERYVLIITNLLGGAYTRYIVGDVIEITALRDGEANINIPQMSFYSRIDDNIDLEYWDHAYFTEKIVWQGINSSGIPYVDWVARKEVEDGKPILSLYIEQKGNNTLNEEKITSIIHEEFKKLVKQYKETELVLGAKPLKVKIVPNGAFARYIEYRRAAGADPAHTKPPHINPSDSVMRTLLGDKFIMLPSAQKNLDEVKIS